LRDRLEQGLTRAIDGFVVNGDPARRVPGVLSAAFPGVDSETLLVALDQRELYAASGSACSSGAIDPSHVLLAMGLGDARARASVRFSLGHTSTGADIDAALDIVPGAVRQLVGAAA
jgi:cysteine desulfurase